MTFDPESFLKVVKSGKINIELEQFNVMEINGPHQCFRCQMFWILLNIAVTVKSVVIVEVTHIVIRIAK